MPDASKTYGNILRNGIAALRAAGLDTPELDARVLLCHAGLMDASTLITRGPDAASENIIDQFQAYIDRRIRHEPVAYIVGYREFWDAQFIVTPDTLIPRPDSEALIEAALAWGEQQGRAPKTILDLGLGSGCLLAILLKQFPEAIGIGVDRSFAALQIARQNINKLGLAGRARLICGSWLQAISGAFDLVISNPPYIAHTDYPFLAPDIKDYEPDTALVSPDKGRAEYRNIIKQSVGALSPRSALILEMGDGHAGWLPELACQYFPDAQISLRDDLTGTPRALIIAKG